MNLTQKEELKGFSKYVGFELFNVVAVNPTVKQVNKLLGKEDSEEDEEINYLDEKDGNLRIKLTVYMKGLQTERIHKESFFIVDKVRLSKVDENDPDKVQTTQYINNFCDATFVDSEENLPAWFKTLTRKKTGQVLGEKEYRKALEGEADFYTFARGVLGKVDFYLNPRTSIIFDIKKLKRGDFSEVNSVLTDSDYCSPVCLLNYVSTDVEDTEKQYQRVWTKNPLPTSFYTKIEMAIAPYYRDRVQDAIDHPNDYPGIKGLPLAPSDIYGWVDGPESIKFKDSYDQKTWDNFIKNSEGKYGVSGFYKFTPVFEYNKEMDITAGNKTLSPTDSSY